MAGHVVAITRTDTADSRFMSRKSEKFRPLGVAQPFEPWNRSNSAGLREVITAE